MEVDDVVDVPTRRGDTHQDPACVAARAESHSVARENTALGWPCICVRRSVAVHEELVTAPQILVNDPAPAVRRPPLASSITSHPPRELAVAVVREGSYFGHV